MAKQEEKNIQNAILRYLNYFVPGCVAFEIYNGGIPVRAIGSKIIFKKNSEWRPKGTPDIQVYLNGEAFMIETKVKNGVTSPDQAYFRAKLKAKAGAIVYYCRSVDDAVLVVKSKWK